MGHVFFFSYAHANRDKELERFFEDLCDAVKGYTTYSARDPRLSFRDGNNLALMEEWRPHLLDALQTSAILVCATSPAYFGSRMCGQEYYVFDQRRKNMADSAAPPVILPVIWVPDPDAPQYVLDLVQWQSGEIDPFYQQKGLRYLMKIKPNEYERCVILFAEAIGREWQSKRQMPPLLEVAPFADIPNAFGGGTWEEAATPQGWLPGPSVATFVFAAGLVRHFPGAADRYGNVSSQWRPFLPPERTTVLELAKRAARQQSFRFREIPNDENLVVELAAACQRKNLILLVADPHALTLPHCNCIQDFDRQEWDGTAVLIPWNPQFGRWQDHWEAIQQAFSIRCKAAFPPFLAPIRTIQEFTTSLEETLAALRARVIHAAAADKEHTDSAPAQLATPGVVTK